MSFRDKLDKIATPMDLFPELSPMRKRWNSFVVWLYNKFVYRKKNNVR